jgi:hypothetical protein
MGLSEQFAPQMAAYAFEQLAACTVAAPSK